MAGNQQRIAAPPEIQRVVSAYQMGKITSMSTTKQGKQYYLCERGLIAKDGNAFAQPLLWDQISVVWRQTKATYTWFSSRKRYLLSTTYLSSFPRVELLSSRKRHLKGLEVSEENSISPAFALIYSNGNSSLFAIIKYGEGLVDKIDSDPKALACYGMLSAESGHMHLRFVSGYPRKPGDHRFSGVAV